MKKVVTLGEIMLRLSPPGYQRFVQAESLDVVYGGGEANVAVSLANYGYDAYFVSKLPKHEIGQAAVNHLRRFGVHTDYVARGGDRVGIYYLEAGASMRPSKVVYDRAGSSIAEAAAEARGGVEIDARQIVQRRGLAGEALRAEHVGERRGRAERGACKEKAGQCRTEREGHDPYPAWVGGDLYGHP